MKRDLEFRFPSGDGGFYSGLRVLKSGAGYYIGRMHWNPELGGFIEPGTRESGYYHSDAQARHELETMTFTLRTCAENESLYAAKIVPRPEVRS